MKPAGPHPLTPEPTNPLPPQTFPAPTSYTDEAHAYGEKNGVPYWPTLPAVLSDIPPSLLYNWKPPPPTHTSYTALFSWYMYTIATFKMAAHVVTSPVECFLP